MLPPAIEVVSAGWFVSVHSLQEFPDPCPAAFFVITCGKLFVAGAEPVVAATEADHAPSTSPFAARTCTR